MTGRRPSLTTRAQIVRPALMLMRRAGDDPTRLIREFGLPSTTETDREVILPLATLHTLMDAVAQAAGDPLLGVHLWGAFPRGSYGVLDYLGPVAETVHDLLRGIVRYTPLINEVVVASITVENGLAHFRHAIPGEPLCLGRHGNECMLAMLLKSLRRNTGIPMVPARAWLAHPEPENRAQLEAALEMPGLEYGAESNGLALPVAFLETPILGADPVLHGILVQHAERQLTIRRSESRFIGQVKQTLRDEVRERLPTLDATARAMRTSPRALQRRLQAEKTTFQDVLDAVREELARGRLRDGAASIGQVAFELQYSDESTFVRAFKRWTGMTPGAFRASLA